MASSPALGSARLTGLTAEGTRHEAFELTDWLLFLGAGLIWGTSFLSISEGLKAFHPGVVTFLRIGIGAITLGLMPRARTKVDRADLPRIAALGVTWLAFPMTLFPLAQQHINSGLAGMLNGSIPLFAAVVGGVLLRRAPGRNQLLGLGVGVVGLVLLGWPAIGKGGSSAVGVLLVVVACFSYGWAVNLNVPLVQKYGSVPVFWRSQVISSVLTLPFAVYGFSGGRSSWNFRAGFAMVILGVFSTAVAFVWMSMLSARVGGARSASLTYFEAVVALLVGWAVANEKVVGLEVVGCAILMAGAWLSARADRAF